MNSFCGQRKCRWRSPDGDESWNGLRQITRNRFAKTENERKHERSRRVDDRGSPCSGMYAKSNQRWGTPGRRKQTHCTRFVHVSTKISRSSCPPGCVLSLILVCGETQTQRFPVVSCCSSWSRLRCGRATSDNVAFLVGSLRVAYLKALSASWVNVVGTFYLRRCAQHKGERKRLWMSPSRLGCCRYSVSGLARNVVQAGARHS